MKRIIIFAMCMVCAFPVGATDVMISGLLYDAEGSDDGKEWIELYNPSDVSRDLSEYAIEGGNGANQNEWWTEWNGTGGYIPPNGHVLIGGDNVSPRPDEIVNLQLQNGPDACRLLHEGEVVETVGWGDLEYEEYFEGTPFDGAEGAVSRVLENGTYSDTGNNSYDFEKDADYTPTPRDQRDVTVSFSVIERYARFVNISLPDDDPLAEGMQVLPRPGEVRELPVRIEVLSNEPCDTLNVRLTHRNATQGMEPEGEMDNRCVFSSNVSMNYSQNPGTYDIGFDAVIEDTHVNSTTRSFEYLELAAFNLDSDVLHFGELHKGEKMRVEGDMDPRTREKPTIENIGNTPLDLGMMGSQLSADGTSLNASVLTYRIDNGGEQHEGSFTYGPSQVGMNLPISGKAAMSLTLSVPSDASGGEFSGDLAFLARKGQ